MLYTGQKEKYIWALFSVTVLAILYFVNPVGCKYMPKCIFKLLTGLSCPGCGMQRALHAFLNGRFAEAISYNYYLVLVWPYLLVFFIQRLFLREPLKEKVRRVIEGKPMVYTCILSTFAWIVIRNIYNL